jgi:hypothetical protein
MKYTLSFLAMALFSLASADARADCPHPPCWSVCQSGDLCSEPCCDNDDAITCGQYYYAPPCCQPQWVITNTVKIAEFCTWDDSSPSKWLHQSHFQQTWEDLNHCTAHDSFVSCYTVPNSCTKWTTEAACCAANGCWGQPGCGLGDYNGDCSRPAADGGGRKRSSLDRSEPVDLTWILGSQGRRIED